MKNAILWKRILNEGLDGEGLPSEELRLITNQIIKAPIIVDTRPIGGLGPDAKISDFRRLSIPFPYFWMEGMKLNDLYFGAEITVTPVDDHREITGLIIANLAGRRPFAIGGATASINTSSDLIDVRAGATSHWIRKFGRDEIHAILGVGALAICDTLQLLGCKNVSLAPRETDPKQVRRAIKRHGGTPDSYRYHILVVRQPGAKSDSPSQEIGIMPRHVARGHFAEYGPEFGKGLLFGKYGGRFYIPPHLRGRKENGVVEKDYEVRP